MVLAVTPAPSKSSGQSSTAPARRWQTRSRRLKREMPLNVELSESEDLVVRQVANALDIERTTLVRAALAIALPILVSSSFMRKVTLEDVNVSNLLRTLEKH